MQAGTASMHSTHITQQDAHGTASDVFQAAHATATAPVTHQQQCEPPHRSGPGAARPSTTLLLLLLEARTAGTAMMEA